MKRNTVLIGTAALVLAIAAMSATGSGIRDVIDPDLTDEVEALVEGSVLREYAGLQRTPIPPSPDGTPAPVPVDNATGVVTGIPGSGSAHFGAPFVEIPLVVGDGYTPLTDLDTLYGVYGYRPPAAAVPAQPHGEPPMVDDTPAMIAAAWNPPLDIK